MIGPAMVNHAIEMRLASKNSSRKKSMNTLMGDSAPTLN